MKSSIVFSAILLLLAMPNVAGSQVTDLPAGPYGGMFRDESTGKIWLDYDALQSNNYGEMQARLSSSPFRFATRSDLEPLLNEEVLSQDAVGAFASCYVGGGAFPPCKMALFDDSETGQDAELPGLMGIIFTEHVLWTYDDSASWHLAQGAWAVQRAPALCASAESYSSDMNCDGIDEKVVWRPNSGMWFVRFSGSNELLMQQWGLPGDIPLFGDYDGDHIPDLVVWRPSNGTWYVKTSSSLFDASQALVQQFGLPGDVPMRGDYDGDGIFDYAVWRPSEGNWYVLQSSTQQAVVEQWGLPEDVPLVGGRAAQ